MEDAVATTPAPNPHNQTTSAQAEVTGRVFLFSFCVVFCKFVFCIKCVSVSLGFSLAGSLTHVESPDGASEDAVDRQSDDVVVATTPDHHNQTQQSIQTQQSAHTSAGGE